MMDSDEDQILQRLGYVAESLYAIGVDVEIERPLHIYFPLETQPETKPNGTNRENAMMNSDEDQILQRLGCVAESLATIGVDVEIERLPPAKARTVANNWYPPPLPNTREGMCELMRSLIDHIEGRILSLPAEK